MHHNFVDACECDAPAQGIAILKIEQKAKSPQNERSLEEETQASGVCRIEE